MSTEKKIIKLKRQMDDLEKDKIRTEGAVASELNQLAQNLGDDVEPEEAEEIAKKFLKKLKKKREKAEVSLAQLYKEIEASAYESGLEI